MSEQAGCVLSEKAKVCFYPAWCKRCGNCVAFCPRKALAADKWGHPYLPDLERCTGCGLCEMLCPDFAITVGEAKPREVASQATSNQDGAPAGHPAPQVGPERLAPAPIREEN